MNDLNHQGLGESTLGAGSSIAVLAREVQQAVRRAFRFSGIGNSSSYWILAHQAGLQKASMPLLS